MREILFKARRLSDGEWVEGYYIGPIGVLDVHEICDIHDITGPRVEVDPSTVCQYTGLTDKNGKKIFEGDNVYDPHENSIYTVEWNENNAIFQMAHDWRRRSVETAYYCEIIGNIHDGEQEQSD
ncbi:hypothetical protein H8S45_14495 [Agathobaculum sp. NSJ-28]|uniref:YopX protein domain-containing protein n=1 Tax=Agathobaculum faecis TaxID=2763013 RepID=A0A923RZV7_9FIRM|nr:YopX family protein [Agathobaculum faecis]MBC5726660.1 hypothetical protein [Agathobaculum faecis]